MLQPGSVTELISLWRNSPVGNTGQESEFVNADLLPKSNGLLQAWFAIYFSTFLSMLKRYLLVSFRGTTVHVSICGTTLCPFLAQFFYASVLVHLVQTLGLWFLVNMELNTYEVELIETVQVIPNLMLLASYIFLNNIYLYPDLNFQRKKFIVIQFSVQLTFEATRISLALIILLTKSNNVKTLGQESEG